MSSLAILGRQPALGLAELESLYGASCLRPVGTQAVLIDKDVCAINFDRLGGTVKLCNVLTVFNTINWSEIESSITSTAPEHSRRMPAGKMTLGISAYGLAVTPRELTASGFKIKQAIRQTERSVRLVPNVETALSSAQVLHNKLTNDHAWELVLVRYGSKTICAQTNFVQNINSYTLRDRGRPMRDTKIGMLPPKLAQIIVNLATGDKAPTDQTVVFDPFCGTGVVLQEAMLMGYGIYGSDNNERMLAYTEENLRWLLKQHFDLPTTDNLLTHPFDLVLADAASTKWQTQPDFIASETYLGRAFSSQPERNVLNNVIRDVDTIINKFLKNVSDQVPAGFRLCVAVPAWRVGKSFQRLPSLDHLERLGYTRLSFKYAAQDQLIYHREGQIVGRELVVITRK